MRKILPLLLLLAACNKVEVDGSRGSPTSPSTSSKIEYRVTGNPTSVRVRMSNDKDGLTQFTTTLPYNTSFKTDSTSMFLSLEATPISYSALTLFPFLSVQIFVDGDLFREATSNEFLLNTISVNGTWRK